MDARIERRIPKEPTAKREIANAIVGVLAGRGFPKYLTTESAAEIESQGFDPIKVQEYIDDLNSRIDVDDQIGAAMLRGAFNDLLSRIPDDPITEAPDETATAA